MLLTSVTIILVVALDLSSLCASMTLYIYSAHLFFNFFQDHFLVSSLGFPVQYSQAAHKNTLFNLDMNQQ